jgi:glycosyltransferase involved in cell wall biosynthesis
VFAFPSLMEASPNAVLEAMAAGLAVAATNVGGIPEVVRHEDNGLLVAPGDPAPLADAVQRLVTEPGLAERLGRRARATVEQRFSFERMVGQFERLYRGSAAAHGDRVPDPVDELESGIVQ